MTFKWNAEKNRALARDRGITFEEIVAQIAVGARVIETAHPNQERYPGQIVLIVEVEGYAYMVPCVPDASGLFMKTIIPSRKATRKYLRG